MLNSNFHKNLYKLILINFTVIIVLPFNVILENKGYISQLLTKEVFFSFLVFFFNNFAIKRNFVFSFFLYHFKN